MSEELSKRQSVREISSLFDTQKSVPNIAVRNITVNEIRKRNSFRCVSQPGTSQNVEKDSSVIEFRNKRATLPGSVCDEVKICTLDEKSKNNVDESLHSEVQNSVSEMVTIVNEQQSTGTKEDVSKIISPAVTEDESVIKDKKIILCRLLLKNDTGECSWTGCHDEFIQHCKENHAHQLAMSASETIGWTITKLYKNTITVRIFDDNIFWCYHRVTTDDSPGGGMMYWTVLQEGCENYFYFELKFYMKGNIYKRVIFAELCLASDSDVENVFRCKRCIAIPKNLLQLYFGVGDDYMDQLYCELTIKNNVEHSF